MTDNPYAPSVALALPEHGRRPNIPLTLALALGVGYGSFVPWHYALYFIYDYFWPMIGNSVFLNYEVLELVLLLTLLLPVAAGAMVLGTRLDRSRLLCGTIYLAAMIALPCVLYKEHVFDPTLWIMCGLQVPVVFFTIWLVQTIRRNRAAKRASLQ